MESKIELNVKLLKEYGNTFDINERKKLIGEMLQAVRLKAGLTQNEVSELIGIKAGTYSTYENGTREAPAEVIVRLSMLYDIPTDILLQVGRLARDNFDLQNQFNSLNNTMDELKSIMTDHENELNPQFAEMLQAMTNAFDQMGKEIKQTNKDKK